MTTATAPATRYAVNGTNDDEHVCAKCGRTELRRVVWLTPLDADGNPVGPAQPYGTNCAARLIAPTERHSAAATLVALVDAMTYARKWIANSTSVDAIASAVRTRYGVRADVEAGRLVFHTAAGTVAL